MIKRIIVYTLLSFIFGLLFYFLTNKFLLSLLVFLIYCAFFFVFYEIKYRNYRVTIRKTRECIQFINNFIITLSVNNSIVTTFNVLSTSFSKELKEQVNSINHLNDEEKIIYLKNYFNSSLYSVFVDLLKQFIEDGGNIINNTHLLIFDTRLIEENLNDFLVISNKKLFQFGLMWGLCFIILLITKVALGNYYLKIQLMNYYPYSLFLFFILFLVFLYFILRHYLDLNFINEELKDEKNKKQNWISWL